MRIAKWRGMAVSGIAALSFFVGGFVSGQSKFGQPKTILHVVSIQWKANVPDGERQKVLDGVKKMAWTLPGVKNVWMKSDRVEPRGYDDGFAIEFRDRAAADAYAMSAIHKSWNEKYLPLKAASVSIDLTNP